MGNSVPKLSISVIKDAGFTPVCKSLPNVMKPVLTITDYGKMDVCRMTISEDLRSIIWVNDMRPQHSNGGVIGWMDLPEVF